MCSSCTLNGLLLGLGSNSPDRCLPADMTCTADELFTHSLRPCLQACEFANQHPSSSRQVTRPRARTSGEAMVTRWPLLATSSAMRCMGTICWRSGMVMNTICGSLGLLAVDTGVNSTCAMVSKRPMHKRHCHLPHVRSKSTAKQTNNEMDSSTLRERIPQAHRCRSRTGQAHGPAAMAHVAIMECARGWCLVENLMMR